MYVSLGGIPVSVMLPHRRTALRAATTTAALAGALLLPSAAAFADTGSTTAPAAGTTSDNCTATKTMSIFGDMTVDLSISPAGPKAVLKSAKGKAVATVDRAHPVDGPNGLMIKYPDSTAPLFLDVSEGGSALWRSNPFPKLPEDCANTAKPAPVATIGSAAPQTSAVPAGAVAAGATGVGHGNTSLVAGGGALAVASAAALGFVVTRRRRAADAGR